MWKGAEAYVQQLRVVLQSAEASERERAWLKLKSNGDLDETRLVDAAIGERQVPWQQNVTTTSLRWRCQLTSSFLPQVFKQRGLPPLRLGSHQSKPKHMTFLLDASASMQRGDSFDGRECRRNRSLTHRTD